MNKQALVAMLLTLLQNALDQQADGHAPTAESSLPLVGKNAVISSLGLVSFIADAELSLAEEHDIVVTLVSEQALSRQKSPFRSVDTLADYILELDGQTTRK
jgi:hypothetical protein